MRKGILVTLLALFTVFAMVGVVSCGDKDSGTKPPAGTTFTIEKDLNWASVSATGQPANPPSVQTDTAKKLTTAQLAEPGPTQTPAGYEFDDWYTAGTGGTKVTNAHVFGAAGKIYAHWKALPPPAGKAQITFNANGGTFPGGASVWSTPQFDAGVITDEMAEVIMADYPGDPERANYEFEDWYTLATGGTIFDGSGSIPGGVVTNAYAHWTSLEGPEPGEPFVEKVFLENGAYAIYKFDLTGTGTTWSDYEKLTVDYQFDATNLASAQAGIRGARLLGMYKPGSYALTSVTEEDDNGLLVMRMNGDTLNNYIVDNTTAFPAAITAANTWTTITYNIQATTGKGDPGQNHSGWNVTGEGAGEAAPANGYAGVLYVALGITKGFAPYSFEVGGETISSKRPALTDGITQLIKNVTLVGFEEDTDPLVATKPLASEPQFVTYIDPVVFSWRGAEDAAVVIPSAPEEPPLVEKVFLENGAYAIYKFNLGINNSKWSDYEKLTVNYKFDADNLASAQEGIRGARLLGMYMPGSFALTEGNSTLETDDNGLVVMRMNGDTLNNYIVDNTIAFPAAITAANTWTTISYNIQATTGKGDPGQNHSGWNGTGDGAGEAAPANNYNKVLYVALGITKGYAPYGTGETEEIDGEDVEIKTKRPTLTDGITQWISEVTLVGFEDANVVPLVATKPGATEPQFVTYIDPVAFSWRGGEDAAVVIPEFPPEERFVVALGDFTWDNGASQMGWKSDECDDETHDLAWATIADARYLVVKYSDTASQVNFAKIVVQSAGNGWGWSVGNKFLIGNDMVTYPVSVSKTYYVVINLRSEATWVDFASKGPGKFLFDQMKFSATPVAWLTDEDMSGAFAIETAAAGGGDYTAVIIAAEDFEDFEDLFPEDDD